MTTVYPFRTPTLPPATTTNTVFLGSSLLAVVDPSTPYADEQNRFDEILKKHIANGATPQAVLLTHHHPDHVGDAERVAQRFSLPIWAHQETANRVSFSIDRLLKDQEIILTTWQAIHTPGHAAGHLCFFDQDTKTLVAGDMVASEGTILIDPAEGHMATYLESLQKLLNLPIKTVIPAHGTPLENGKRKLQETLEHRLFRQEQIFKTLSEKGALDADDLVPIIYSGQVPESMFPLAKQSLLSALQMLVEQRRAQVDKNGAYRVIA